MTKYAEYEKALRDVLWAWACRNHWRELDGVKRRGRPPPYLAEKFKSKNVLVPPDKSRAERIRDIIPQKPHRLFCSFRSSQALTISVFGAVKEYNRLDLLEKVKSECGRQAFFCSSEGMNMEFEKKVGWLGERSSSPTSVDVFLSGAGYRIAVECKFTEREFDDCSRPGCDGSYSIQGRRSHRCALTEKGIRYWKYLPDLFHWPPDRDHDPCLFDRIYQLARNAMAAAVTPDGRLDPTGGHVLVVYDARNPQFLEGGAAWKQLEWAEAECRVHGLCAA